MGNLQMIPAGQASDIFARGLLGGKNDADKALIVRQSEVFYFNRITGHSITVEDTHRYEQSLCASTATDMTATSGLTSDEPRVLTFMEIKDLIEQDRTDQIPNNKHIPDTVNVCSESSYGSILILVLASQDASPSESTAQSRKKPWEMAVEGSNCYQ